MHANRTMYLLNTQAADRWAKEDARQKKVAAEKAAAEREERDVLALEENNKLPISEE